MYNGDAWAAFSVRARPARQNPVLGRAATLLESVVNWARFHAPKRNDFRGRSLSLEARGNTSVIIV